MSPALQITIPYKPRSIFRPFHDRTERWAIMVAHRRAGKTVACVNELIKAAMTCPLPDGRFAYTAPLYAQAKDVAWMYLRKFTAPIPGVNYHESELRVDLPNGARIRLYGLDNYERLRGTYFDLIVLDEFGDADPRCWGEVIRPALADRKGSAIFIGTPKGINHFYELWQEVQNNPDWYKGFFPADETGIIPDGELELARAAMAPNAFRQEFLCDFSASSDNVLIPVDIASDASRRTIDERILEGIPRIVGVDVARYGADRSCIFKRCGLAAYTPLTFEKIDNMDLVGRVANIITQWNPDAVFIDGGRGEGVIDRLRQLGHDVIEVNFGGRADNPRFANKRTEIWNNMAEWLKDGGCIPNLTELKADLCGPTYSFDSQNRMVLESKDHLKERGLRSPDLADALALTWAYPVHPRIGQRGQSRVVSDYNPYEVV